MKIDPNRLTVRIVVEEAPDVMVRYEVHTTSLDPDTIAVAVVRSLAEFVQSDEQVGSLARRVHFAIMGNRGALN